MDRNFAIFIVIGVIVVLGLGWYAYDVQTMDDMDMENDVVMDDMDMNNGEGVMVGGAAMLPSRTIVENAMNADNLSTLVQAVQAAGLVDALSGEGPFTVFAPTNAAFADLPDGTLNELLQPENQDQLASILEYHVVAGTYTSADLEDGQELETINGDTITITVDAEGNYMVNGAMIQTADVIDSNGVSHVIGEVLMPGENQQTDSTDDDMSSSDEDMQNMEAEGSVEANATSS